MGIFDGLLNTVAGIGGQFLQAELSRKAGRRQQKLAQFGFQSGNGIGPPLPQQRQFPPVGGQTPVGVGPQGGRMTVAIPSGLSNREFKTAMCRAVRERLVHPAQATAELKMRGLKGCTRRMNPLNPRALTRAARRMEGFLRTVKRIEKAIPTKTRKVRATGHTHALKSTGVVGGG